jgi:ribosomal protein S18 acetylase RimI-like enzyme
VREILDATAVFRPEEVDVALELFDESPDVPTDYEFVGAFDDRGELLGYASFGPTPGTDRTYDLYWIATHPAAQGRGVGSRLMTEVEHRLLSRSARLLIVETSSRPAYAVTRRFYETRGYMEAARVRGFYAPDDDRVIYTKRLRDRGRTEDAGRSPITFLAPE